MRLEFQLLSQPLQGQDAFSHQPHSKENEMTSVLSSLPPSIHPFLSPSLFPSLSSFFPPTLLLSNRVLLCSPGCSQTYNPPASIFQGWRLQALMGSPLPSETSFLWCHLGVGNWLQGLLFLSIVGIDLRIFSEKTQNYRDTHFEFQSEWWPNWVWNDFFLYCTVYERKDG